MTARTRRCQVRGAYLPDTGDGAFVRSVGFAEGRQHGASLAGYAKAVKASSDPFVTPPPSRNPVGRPCVGRVAMTDAERARRYRKLSKKRRRAANCEWYTPRWLIDLAVEVMGGIDCDPASCALANETVGARVFHDLRDDGLKQEWHGCTWGNPPYCHPAISLFIDKLVAEFAAGRVTQATVLTNNVTDAGWFETAAAGSSALCFPRRRIIFVPRHGSATSPPQGQAIFYFGPHAERF